MFTKNICIHITLDTYRCLDIATNRKEFDRGVSQTLSLTRFFSSKNYHEIKTLDTVLYELMKIHSYRV